MNRKELLYLYDASYCNPNGDPADENKPRTDPETQINLVSDVRLKRTIRDFLHEIHGKNIFVLSTANDEGIVPTAKARANTFMDPDPQKGENFNQVKQRLDKKIIAECIDVRLFGATIPLEFKLHSEKKAKTGSITHTGPVQFKMGKSLHQVSVERIKGTGAFASKENAAQNAFRVEYVVPYSLISFHGIVNEHRAAEVELKDSDLSLLYDSMWNGIKHLITRSKIGQSPRLLLVVTYKEKNFQISDLDNKVKVKSELSDLALRSVDDYVLSLDRLIDALKKHVSKIKKIEYEVDEHLQTSYGDSVVSGEGIEDLLKMTGAEIGKLGLE